MAKRHIDDGSPKRRGPLCAAAEQVAKDKSKIPSSYLVNSHELSMNVEKQREDRLHDDLGDYYVLNDTEHGHLRVPP